MTARIGRVGAVIALVTGTLLGTPAAGLAVPASACSQAPSPGVPIPPTAPRDPLISELGLDQAWPLATGSGVTVGVVDTGVDPASPKLRGAVDMGQTYRVLDTAAGYTHAADGRVDCDGHGTEVAGIIAGRTAAGDDRVSGVAPGVRIYPVAIQGDIAQAPAALIAAAIRDAAAHSSIVNLSFAQPTDSPEIRAAVEDAVAGNVIVVAAAANETGVSPNGGASVWYPAAYPGVLAVASVSADGSPDQSGARGDWISIAAPGESLTTVSRGGQGYVTVTGTSFATAIVSGAAALLRQRFPTMPPAQVIARLEHTAVPPGDGSHDDAVGYGTVDPYAALTSSAVPGAATVAPRHGAVPVQQVKAATGGENSSTVLAVVALLAALAVLVGLGTLSVRAGRRRGWHPGAVRAAEVDARSPEPHPAELG
jgi:membrane-anchored mycosin MYCP